MTATVCRFTFNRWEEQLRSVNEMLSMFYAVHVFFKEYGQWQQWVLWIMERIPTVTKKQKKNNAEMQSWHIISLRFMTHFYFIYTEWVNS